ncbi:superoxide dismutase family protein [Qingshengfaniella alkalisoli]|uniref:Superoxide dismutase family protein n=1 Tax=Qingshengfaniella alkalisoli TaxID=2599296 RepID=A0A5B8I976_9RHOB|nr:superoxide dismutase family protein [Qingshengfaniella alkalisoli]QDY70765.1 superoxide dismutase family protein [Qingshengfaniella alkalisoli]
MKHLTLTVATIVGLGGAAIASAATADTAQAALQDRDGNAVGTVTVSDTESGRALISVDIDGVPAGPHGIHIHETGDCSADDFSSAGGHMSGDAGHGVHDASGPHPGDLPNLNVPESGTAMVEHFSPDLTVADMMDDNGSAFIVHSGPDDYTSQPSGAAGDRIACGVFEAG